ncbi:hypothetical protein BSLG_005814 [Batrachochytrium salamandrivorans]|nr:hypothetical protein BSLG_005814 [Batrachochytrium salamandrivorans]
MAWYSKASSGSDPLLKSPATNSTTSPTSPPFTSVRSSQSLLTPPASFNTLLRAPQPTLWSSAVSAHSGTSISSGSASIDSSTSMPAMIFNEIMSMQINLSNPVITFRGVNQGHLLDNDLASLQGHVYVHFKDPLMSLARVRLRIVGEEFVRAFSDRSKPSKLRGSVSYRVEVLLDIREEPNELNNWKSGGNIEMVACLSDFRVQRVPTFSELKIYSKPTTISKLQVNCFVTGSRIILAHQAGPKTLLLKSSLLAKVKPEFKSYVRDRNVLGAREIPREAIGPRILLDLYDISAAQVLNQTMFGKHLEVSHHLAVEVHIVDRPQAVLMEIPIVLAFT